MDDPLANLVDAGLASRRDQRYAPGHELGRGSMGVVYAGRDLLLDRPVAIKMMAAAISGDAELSRCFEREARAAARLAHRNIVTVHDFGCDARGVPFVVMELLRGRDLRQALATGRPLPLDRRLAIVLQVLAALAHAHASGVVHRDVKPANVFITADGVVKLLDFGIARLGRAGAADSSNAVMGTADYMSPEQVLGGEVDGRSDLFGCAALLFELLTGRPPFHADSFVAIAYRVVHEEPDYTSLPAPCRALEPVLRKALAKSRDDRYALATDFATDIALAMGVGVAPERIKPAPAWTVPLPRLAPGRPLPETVAVRQRWEDDALRPPDLSPVRPRWPLQPPGDEDAAAPGRPGMNVQLAALAAVLAGLLALAAGRGRPEPATAGVRPGLAAEVPAAAPVGPTPLQAENAAPAHAGPSPASASEVAAAPRPLVAPRRAAALPGGAASFWTVVAPRPAGRSVPGPTAAVPPAAPPSVLPAPRERPLSEGPSGVVRGRWIGYVTDDLCREKGALDDHGQCLEACLRRGRRALFAIEGQLYALVGRERIRGSNDRRVVVEGQLDARRRVLTVTAGWPAR